MKKAICLLLVLTVILNMPTITALAEEAPKKTVIIAGSDFQHPNGPTQGANEVTSIIKAIKNSGIDHADALLFCGDYDYDTYEDDTSVNEGVSALKNAVSEYIQGQIILTQGNHDTKETTNGMSPGGANDPQSDAYGVFVINNADYMWKNADPDTITKTSSALDKYLSTKQKENFKKPIFIVSHLPLHYSMRTANDGDGMYADKLFNVINAYAEDGMNIVYLFGHNHSNGWDDYLGGASIYLAKGDEILIAQSSQTKYIKETLSFTYMNAGYVGYYRNHNGADDTLTMTVFTIENNQLTISRFSRDGIHPLKSKGVTNSYKNESGYTPNLKEYPSPQTLTLFDEVEENLTYVHVSYLDLFCVAAVLLIMLIVLRLKRRL